MPEIKHQFTGGKMNKDLDERLVPNGEYRDAMNIQVSTSESSNVGAVQNILGNLEIPEQTFTANAICVGSIADEQNDKLYYFISDHKEMISNTELEDGAGWSMSSQISADYSGEGVLITSDGIGGSQYPNFKTNPHFDLVDGKTYKLNVEFSDINDGGANPTKFFVLGKNGGNSRYRPLYDNLLGDWDNDPNTPDNMSPSGNVQITAEGKYKNIFTFDQSSNNNLTHMAFFIEEIYGGSYAKTIRLKSVSLVERIDTIIEYDSTTNTITPVLVDMTGDVLKFNSDNIITGINIIDDLLLWTDNESEPKKINIQRSIEGTDSSGTIHTTFENDKRTDVSGEPIREEHITVIKKAPKIAPTIELFSERPLDGAKIHTGVMKITTAPTTPMQTIVWDPWNFTGIMQNPSNYQNESSLWADVFSKYNSLYDFSGI